MHAPVSATRSESRSVVDHPLVSRWVATRLAVGQGRDAPVAVPAGPSRSDNEVQSRRTDLSALFPAPSELEMPALQVSSARTARPHRFRQVPNAINLRSPPWKHWRRQSTSAAASDPITVFHDRRTRYGRGRFPPNYYAWTDRRSRRKLTCRTNEWTEVSMSQLMPYWELCEVWYRPYLTRLVIH